MTLAEEAPVIAPRNKRPVTTSSCCNLSSFSVTRDVERMGEGAHR